MVGFISLISCTGLNRPPNLKNPNNGIVAIPFKASNSSRMDFYRYYKIYSHTNPDQIIIVYPEKGDKFAFSPEMPPGIYNFNRIKSILDGQVARSTKHTSVKALEEGINVEIKSGSVTVATERLLIMQWDWHQGGAMQDWRLETVPKGEMQSLIDKVRGVGGLDQWQIVNEFKN